jgi:UDP-N-acetylmuramoyl-L-alanyl-D-glutamate--2,6-diaminopimelate ligase
LQRSGTKYTLEPDRRKAISLAIEEANSGDIVLIAGKGHEKVQVTSAGTVPFDDIDEATKALLAAGYGTAQGQAANS